MIGFVNLEVHSNYSLSEGTMPVERLAAFGRDEQFPFAAICDTNGFYGLIFFLKACAELKLRPIIGCRIEHWSFCGILIAKSRAGFSEICIIISKLHQSEDFNIKKYLLSHPHPGVVVITSATDYLETAINLPGDKYAEINPLQPNYGRVRKKARALGVPGVLIHPAYFEKTKDHETHKLLRAIYFNKKLSTLQEDEYQNIESCLVSAEEIDRRYSHLTDEILNTRVIANSCDCRLSLGVPIFPSKGPNSFITLRTVCYKNIAKRYENPSRKVFDRLEKELDIIRKKGFSDYFLVVQDFVSRSQITCGRGSAAASLVSYLLFITHVDPIAHDLFFERFLHEERKDPPDIDIDFAWDKRDEILEYIFDTYGRSHAAMVANHITFSVRSSFREVAKVCGVPNDEIKQFTRRLTWFYDRNSDSIMNKVEISGLVSRLRRLLGVAATIEGNIRHLSVHCGGVVITPKPIEYYIPVEIAAKGVPVIQLEKDQAEDYGLVKIDVLGNRSLAVVRDTIEVVNFLHRSDPSFEPLDYADLNPLQDRETLLALASGSTLGVFYVESPAMRQLQKKTGVGDYEHLVIHSSLIRPAANMFIEEYVERLKGKTWKPLIPEMGELLRETYGIMCYQEDITKIAVAVADFSIQEGEELRKVVSNKRKAKRKEELRKQFFEGLTQKNIDRKVVEQIWAMIESFSGYSFCKPHSASYALLSFKACYLKIHYPAEFMGAVLKNQGGFYTPLAYISEARRMGLRVHLPEINESRKEHYGKDKDLYIGFMVIKGLSAEIQKRLVDKRIKHGVYIGLINFIQRTEASCSDTVLLIKAGCFRAVEQENISTLVLRCRRFFSANGEKSDQANGLFWEEEHRKPTKAQKKLRDCTFEERMELESEIFGFIISVHPMCYYRKTLLSEQFVPGKDLSKHVGKWVSVAGILVTAKTVLTKNSDLMQFISFEDETAIYETTFFPRVYKEFGHVLQQHMPYILFGKVEENHTAVSLNVQKVEKIGLMNHRLLNVV